MKNKLTKVTSLGLISLLTIASPVSYASTFSDEDVSSSHGTVVHSSLTSDAPTLPDKAILSSHTTLVHNSFAGNTSASYKPVIRALHPAALKFSPQIRRVGIFAESTESELKKEPKLSEEASNLGKEEELIKQVFGADMGNVFRKAGYYEREEVIEFVQKIQEILGTDADDLCKWIHDGRRLNFIRGYASHSGDSWFLFIINVLDGYLRGEKQYNHWLCDSHIGVYCLTLSLALCKDRIPEGRIEKIKQIIDYLRMNRDKFEQHNPNYCPSPDEVIYEFQRLNGNREFSDKIRDIIFYDSKIQLAADRIVFFTHLLAQFDELKGDLQNLTFKYKGKSLSFEEALFCSNLLDNHGIEEFEILKNGESIGNFRYDYEECMYQIASLKKLGKKQEVNKTFLYAFGKIVPR